MLDTLQKNLPIVSIGLPVYNGDKYLKKALDSLLMQSITDFELIISDNCSTDNTSNICQEYANKDSRIRYIRQQENIGATSNFHFVLKVASAEYFMWAAHDDLWSSDWLEVLLTEFKKDDLAVRGKAINIDEEGEIIGVTNVTSFNKNQVLKVFMDNESNCRAFYWYALFRTNLLRQINFGLLDSTFGVDTLFIVHLVEVGALRTTNKTYQYYRQHSASSTKLISKNWFGFRRLIYHLFPISSYLYCMRVVNPKYKYLILIAIPFKYIKSQLSLISKVIRLVITGKKY